MISEWIMYHFSLRVLLFALCSVVLCVLKSAVTLFIKVKDLIHCETLNWTNFVV